MRRIKLTDYDPKMGPLIDLQNPLAFEAHHYPGALNYPASKLLLNHTQLLNPTQDYYLICPKGILSRRVGAMLEFYGYHVIQVQAE